MSIILNIESSAQICSVVLSDRGEIIASRKSHIANEHAYRITNFVSEVILEANLIFKQIDAIAVSKGPGSYTGLRIGVSTVKGLCFAIDRPLIAISPLKAMANFIVEKNELYSFKADDLFCAMADAGRMEVYAGLYNLKGEEVREVRADIVDTDTYKEFTDRHRVFFFGNGSEKCKEVIDSAQNAIFIDNIVADAEYMPLLAHKAYDNKEFEDLAYFEPFYLKDFIAAKSVVKGLN